MKKLLLVILILLLAQTGFGQDDNSSASQMSARWICGNFGAYNMPLPLQLEFADSLKENITIEVIAGSFHYEFQNIRKDITVWIQYPRGTDKIECILSDETKTRIDSIEIAVPVREIRDAELRFTAIVTDDNNLFYNARYANFLINQADIPANWHQLSAFDELILLDYHRLNERQIASINDFIRAGGILTILEKFTDAKKLLNFLKINNLTFSQDNNLETLQGRNHILLRSSAQLNSGMILKYKISDNLSFSDELEIIRKDMNKIKLPWSLEFIRNSADYVNIDQTQYFEIKSVDRRSRLMLVIILAIFVTLLILIIGLRYFKNLKTRERMLAVSIFCLVLSGVILLMQSFNSVDYSSMNVNFSTNSNNNVHNLNTELKMLKINHAGSFTFPYKSNFIRIISADSEKPIINAELLFDDKTFTVKASKQMTLYIAAISFNETDKNIAVVSDSEQTITSNLSKNNLQNVLHFNDFHGTAPVNIEKYSSKKLTNPEIPYRNVLNEKLNISNDNRKFYAKLCQNLIRKDREFVTCLTEKTSQNVQILIVPIINQK